MDCPFLSLTLEDNQQNIEQDHSLGNNKRAYLKKQNKQHLLPNLVLKPKTILNQLASVVVKHSEVDKSNDPAALLCE